MGDRIGHQAEQPGGGQEEGQHRETRQHPDEESIRSELVAEDLFQRRRLGDDLVTIGGLDGASHRGQQPFRLSRRPHHQGQGALDTLCERHIDLWCGRCQHIGPDIADNAHDFAPGLVRLGSA